MFLMLSVYSLILNKHKISTFLLHKTKGQENRSIRSKMLCEKVALESLVKFTGKYLNWSFALAELLAETIKKDSVALAFL